MKKKTLVPLIIFLLGICLVGFIVHKTDTHEKNERHITAQLNATTYGERIKNEQDLHYFMCFSHVFPLHFIRFIFPKSGPDSSRITSTLVGYAICPFLPALIAFLQSYLCKKNCFYYTTALHYAQEKHYCAILISAHAYF